MPCEHCLLDDNDEQPETPANEGEDAYCLVCNVSDTPVEEVKCAFCGTPASSPDDTADVGDDVTRNASRVDHLSKGSLEQHFFGQSEE